MIVIMSDLPQMLAELPGSELHLAAGESLFHQGDAVRSLHLVEAGLVHLVRYQSDGAAAVMQRAGPGAVVAEASLHADHYHCGALAMAASRVRRIAADAVRRALDERPEFARAYALHLAREVQRMRQRAELLSMRTVRERLDAWLSFGGALPGRGGWRPLADDLGVTPEALYREIARRRIFAA
jgi:CRP-like cAMP-binding protein